MLQALRPPFQPAGRRLLKELDTGLIGDIKMIHVLIASPVAHIPRIVEKELGGGCLIDIGIYGLCFINMIFKEDPLSVTAKGHLNKIW